MAKSKDDAIYVERSTSNTLDLTKLIKNEKLKQNHGGLNMSQTTNVESIKDSVTRIAVGIAVVLATLTFALIFSGCQPYGDRGYTGAAGKDAVGIQGPTGAAGSSCSTLPADDGSGALIQCENGSSAFIKNGERGSVGAAGAVGTTGSTGAAGLNATSVSMVKLCPNIVGSYSNFPEFAFNIGGKLYATMSTAGVAYTTQLYPGAYTTTTNGANCSFTVNAQNQLAL